jgi:transcriptional regulator with XRE-family HTH domain
MENFGQMIRRLREEQEIPLRKVAAYLDIDQAILSKIEHSTRNLRREQVIQLATYFKTNEKQLLVQWLAEKVITELDNDELELEALNLARVLLKKKHDSPDDEEPSVLDYLKLGEGKEMDNMFNGKKLPSYVDFAKYLFNTATKEKFNESRMNTLTGFIGVGAKYEIYLFYKPDREWLKNNALTLNMIKNLPPYIGKKRLVFASLKYVDDETCRSHHIEFGNIPY